MKEHPVNEPLRARMIPTVLVVSLLTAVAAWGAGADWRVAAGIAAAQALALLGAAEHVRGTFTRDPAKAATRHTWAPRTHAAAVAYALSVDPDEHPAELAAVLALIGVDDLDEVRRIVGEIP